jgi:hypothetical protein
MYSSEYGNGLLAPKKKLWLFGSLHSMELLSDIPLNEPLFPILITGSSNRNVCILIKWISVT